MNKTTDTHRGHKLMTAEIAGTLPALYSTDGQGGSAVAHVKYFSPYSGWTWYATEYDPADGVFFGLVVGLEVELGYFTLAEMENATLGNGVPLVERDLYWTPCTLAEVRAAHASGDAS